MICTFFIIGLAVCKLCNQLQEICFNVKQYIRFFDFKTVELFTTYRGVFDMPRILVIMFTNTCAFSFFILFVKGDIIFFTKIRYGTGTE